MEQAIESVLFSEEQLSQITGRLAEAINAAYAGRTVVVVGVLKGSFIFLADLFRRLTMPCELDFMAASSYGNQTTSTGFLNITKDLTADIAGKDVLLVEDIVDTGNTLSYIKEYLLTKGPESVRICTLFDKPSRRKKSITVEYVGAEIEDLFIVGYGLDFAEHYRNLPYVGILKPEIYQS